MDDSDEPAKYKMIQLKACLQGKAEESISKLGFSELKHTKGQKVPSKRDLEVKEDNFKIISKS